MRVKLYNPYVLYAVVPAFHGEKLNIFTILVSLYMLSLVCWQSEMADLSHSWCLHLDAGWGEMNPISQTLGSFACFY